MQAIFATRHAILKRIEVIPAGNAHFMKNLINFTLVIGL